MCIDKWYIDLNRTILKQSIYIETSLNIRWKRREKSTAKLISESLHIDGAFILIFMYLNIWTATTIRSTQYLYIHAIHQSLCDLMFFTPIEKQRENKIINNDCYQLQTHTIYICYDADSSGTNTQTQSHTHKAGEVNNMWHNL